jgi:hypothetical protein
MTGPEGFVDDDPRGVPTELLQAWWHETIDNMFNDGLLPLRMICDNKAGNRMSISYMAPEEEEE